MYAMYMFFCRKKYLLRDFMFNWSISVIINYEFAEQFIIFD